MKKHWKINDKFNWGNKLENLGRKMNEEFKAEGRRAGKSLEMPALVWIIIWMFCLAILNLEKKNAAAYLNDDIPIEWFVFLYDFRCIQMSLFVCSLDWNYVETTLQLYFDAAFLYCWLVINGKMCVCESVFMCV